MSVERRCLVAAADGLVEDRRSLPLHGSASVSVEYSPLYITQQFVLSSHTKLNLIELCLDQSIPPLRIGVE